jgi:hypothetical protein
LQVLFGEAQRLHLLRELRSKRADSTEAFSI